MIKELKDLKPTVDVLAPGKMKSSRGGALMYSGEMCQWPSERDPTQGGTTVGGPHAGGGQSTYCVCACDPGSGWNS